MKNFDNNTVADLFSLSDQIIDQGVVNGPINRINFQLSELGNDFAMVEAFSHVILLKTDDGLVAFDTSGAAGGEAVVKAIRQWDKTRFNTIIYTHGHIDHVGGCGCFMCDNEERGFPRANVIGHENVAKRFDRYKLTNGYNVLINERQFGKLANFGLSIGGEKMFLPETTPYPATQYERQLLLDIGGKKIELNHAKGETDDHTWAWIPETQTICAGDFFIWNFPNAGNPQKAQRFPIEWAQAMRDMADKNAEYFLPAHGLPIRGKSKIRTVLLDVADALDILVEGSLRMMNEGAKLNDIIHEIQVPQEILSKPYLRPLYDEPEFIIRNIWRMYGGWYDGNPANLKPAKDNELAYEIAILCNGVNKLAKRARELSEQNEHRLACHLIELAVQAERDNPEIHCDRAAIYKERQKHESSLMSKGIFGYAAKESEGKTLA